jgi:hypothetical protein
MFRKCFISLLVLLLITDSLQVYRFTLHLQGGEELCLDDYFADKTLLVYEVDSPNPSVDVKILDPDDQALHQEVK